MSTSRLDIRLQAALKKKIEKAAVLQGYKSLTEYLIHTMSEDADQVIKNHEETEIDSDLFSRFIQACEEAEEANPAAVEAIVKSKR